MKEDLQRTIKLAKAGDIEVFAEIFESLRPIVFAIAYRLVGANDAEDVVMETYLKAWKALPNYNERSSLKTWLYRITYNTAMDCLRSRKRQQGKFISQNDLEHDEINELADERQLTPPSTLMKLEIKLLIKKALSLMDNEHRIAIWLRFADDLSYKEIAAATGVNIGTVMSRIFNGKKKLVKLFDSLEKEQDAT